MSYESNRAETPPEVPFTGTADVERSHEDSVQLRNRVQATPIIAGILTAIAVMLVLTVLGLAVGASALEPRDVGEKVGAAAAIWGIVSAIISFFVGGWVAAKTAAVSGMGSGLMNGFIVGAGVLVIVLWLAGSGVGAVVGLLGSNVDDIANVVEDAGVTQQDVQQEANQADVPDSFDTVRDSAWGTLAGIVLPLVAAAAGGAVGHNERDEVIQSGR